MQEKIRKEKDGGVGGRQAAAGEKQRWKDFVKLNPPDNTLLKTTGTMSYLQKATFAVRWKFNLVENQ